MVTPTSPASADPQKAVISAPSLRILGLLVLVMFLITSTVGGSLALESSYLPLALAGHIGLALVTLGLAGYAASYVGRFYRTLPRAFAAIGALAALGATIAGTVFLLGGQPDGALYAMEGFAGLGIVAGLVMIVAGGPSGKRTAGPAA